MGFKTRLLDGLRTHALERRRGSEWLAKAGLLYWKHYEGASNDIQINGEAELIRRLTSIGMLDTVFDVGANAGDWSTEVLSHAPAAKIHAFEIVPATCVKVSNRFIDDENITVNGIGLSDLQGTVGVSYFPEHDTISSTIDGVAGGIHQESHEILDVAVTTGQTYCEEHSIQSIDLLKIDVEGAEHLVLEGFLPMLERGDIQVIQFEYGMANIFTRHLLIDYYESLGKQGYRIGKLLPSGVDFRDYKPKHEDFIGPNYVAVKAVRTDIIDCVACA